MDENSFARKLIRLIRRLIFNHDSNTNTMKDWFLQHLRQILFFYYIFRQLGNPHFGFFGHPIAHTLVHYAAFPSTTFFTYHFSSKHVQQNTDVNIGTKPRKMDIYFRDATRRWIFRARLEREADQSRRDAKRTDADRNIRSPVAFQRRTVSEVARRNTCLHGRPNPSLLGGWRKNVIR